MPLPVRIVGVYLKICGFLIAVSFGSICYEADVPWIIISFLTGILVGVALYFTGGGLCIGNSKAVYVLWVFGLICLAYACLTIFVITPHAGFSIFVVLITFVFVVVPMSVPLMYWKHFR